MGPPKGGLPGQKSARRVMLLYSIFVPEVPRRSGDRRACCTSRMAERRSARSADGRLGVVYSILLASLRALMGSYRLVVCVLG